MKGYSTKLIHGNSKNQDSYHSLRIPIYDNVSFEFASSKEIEDAFIGRSSAHSYSRISNPTVAELEKRLTYITGSLGTIALSSGMAAIANLILAIAKSGDNIITSPYLFGNTYSLFEYTLKKWGLGTRYGDFNNPENIINLIDANTRAIYLETITNPQLAVFDLENIAEIAKKYKILFIVDNTVTTPYLFSAKDYGVHIEVISTTKYISGGATSVGGAIIDYGNYDWQKNPVLMEDYKKFGKNVLLTKLRKEIYRNLGSCLSPQNAYLQILGLETLTLRIDKSNDNALKLANFLDELTIVKNVNYPGISKSLYYENAKRILKNGFGGILTFALKDKKACFNFMDNLKIIKRSTNINDNKTLIIHPSSTIYCEYAKDKKENLGVQDGMLRLSVGIENLEDIKEDILEALEN